MVSDRLRRARDGALVAGEYCANAAFAVLDPRLRGAGASPAEKRMVLPGDTLVPWPSWRATRAVTIDSWPSEVWPWLAQAGYGRGGWYADMPWWRDAEGHRGRRSSSDHLIPEEQHIAAGQVLLDGRRCDETTGAWTVRACHPGADLVLFSSRRLDGREVPPGSATPGLYLECSWAFVLRPLAGATRLVVRTRVKLHPDRKPVRWLAEALGAGDQAMQRAMLLGIKRRVENSPFHHPGRRDGSGGPGANLRGTHDQKATARRPRPRSGAGPRGLRGGPQPGVRGRR